MDNKLFQHRHFAHCESGVMSALLSHHGLELSEPMIFGISGALTFAYLPFLRFGNMPLMSYRMFPGHIIKKLPRILGIKYIRKTYRNPERAMIELESLVCAGQPVGIQTSAYFTPYFPPEMRFQFNAHNSIVIGKAEGEFIISDPVFEHVQRIKANDLKKARFAKGLGAPKGLIHYPVEVPQSVDLRKIIRKSISKTVNMMLQVPLPWIGLKGMAHLAKHIPKIKSEKKYLRQFLGNIVRMQEEIGTGGAGFRFIYAAFLQECGEHLEFPALLKASAMMTEAGDTWRAFAFACAKAIKNKGDIDLPGIADLLHKCVSAERSVYMMLKLSKTSYGVSS